MWGATGPNSFDCSGLTQWSYAHAGITLPRTAADQWNAGPHPALSDLRAGRPAVLGAQHLRTLDDPPRRDVHRPRADDRRAAHRRERPDPAGLHDRLHRRHSALGDTVTQPTVRRIEACSRWPRQACGSTTDIAWSRTCARARAPVCGEPPTRCWGVRSRSGSSPGRPGPSAKPSPRPSRRAGQVPDARWVRVLDVGSEPVAKRLTVWVVSEWVDGPSLASLIRQEPLRGPVATALVLSCAQAVAAAAPPRRPPWLPAPRRGADPGRRAPAADRPGAHHRAARLHRERRCRAGIGVRRHPGARRPALRVPHRSVAAARLGRPAGTDPRRRRAPAATARRDQPRARRDHRSGALRWLRRRPAAFARDLAALPTAPLHPAPPDADGHRRSAVAPHRLAGGAAAAGRRQSASAPGAWAATSAGSRARLVASSRDSRSRTSTAAAARSSWCGPSPRRVTSFDPQGDGAEDPGGVGLAVDDDPSTQWTTDIYHGSAQFGGLKSGVGLLLDLGRPKTVATAELLLSAPGANLQIRAGRAPPQRPTDLPVVTSRTRQPGDRSSEVRQLRSARGTGWCGSPSLPASRQPTTRSASPRSRCSTERAYLRRTRLSRPVRSGIGSTLTQMSAAPLGDDELLARHVARRPRRVQRADRAPPRPALGRRASHPGPARRTPPTRCRTRCCRRTAAPPASAAARP